MKNPVTKRQKELLSIIYASYKNTGYPPNFDGMREALGVSSNQAVLDLLRALEQKELIRRDARVARGIVILPLGYEILDQRPLVQFAGAASAGPLQEAIEIQGRWEEVSPDIAQLEDTLILKVSGESMINACIHDGDLVLVRKANEFSSGDIVLARHQDEATIKRFISEDAPPYIYLKPENPEYPIINFTEETELVGKVIAILSRSGEWKKL